LDAQKPGCVFRRQLSGSYGLVNAELAEYYRVRLRLGRDLAEQVIAALGNPQFTDDGKRGNDKRAGSEISVPSYGGSESARCATDNGGDPQRRAEQSALLGVFRVHPGLSL
jgi:hypothetical protein